MGMSWAVVGDNVAPVFHHHNVNDNMAPGFVCSSHFRIVVRVVGWWWCHGCCVMYGVAVDRVVAVGLHCGHGVALWLW